MPECVIIPVLLDPQSVEDTIFPRTDIDLEVSAAEHRIGINRHRQRQFIDRLERESCEGHARLITNDDSRRSYT